MRDKASEHDSRANGITNKSNFISLIGNDLITIYVGKNRYSKNYLSGGGSHTSLLSPDRSMARGMQFIDKHRESQTMLP
jgi:hypothetical protein